MLFFIAFISLVEIIPSDKQLKIANQKTNITLSQLDIKYINLLLDQEYSQFVLELPMGVVVNEGGILTEDGYILEDTQTMNRDQHGLKKENRDLNSENPMFFKGRLAVISSPGSENWYHWLLEILPRLMVLVESGIKYDKIYINRLEQEWQKKSLKAVLDFLNISEDKLLIINTDCAVKASVLVVPSVPFIPSKGTPLPSWMVDKLRKIFLDNKSDEKRSESYEKIYISRANASIRRVANEKELTKELKKLGFKILHLEKLSPHEQARIFNEARVIIGPHGSGFANLIFTNKDYMLIEIDNNYDISEPRSFYKRLTQITSGVYKPFYAPIASEDFLDEDMQIDVRKFIDFLEKSMQKINL